MMKGAVLEVIVVSAEGIGGSFILGNAAASYHVVLECGPYAFRSKTSSGRLEKIYWNEKFTFKLTRQEVETASFLKLKIMSEGGYLSDDEFVGETLIFLKGMMVEGSYRGGTLELKPSAFNVVVEDDRRYRGEVTLGLRFIADVVFDGKKKKKKRGGEIVMRENEQEVCCSRRRIEMSSWSWMNWWTRLFLNPKHNY